MSMTNEVVVIGKAELLQLIGNAVSEQLERLKVDLMPQPADKLLTKSEAARFLRIAPATLVRYVKSNEVPCTWVGDKMRFSENELQRIYINVIQKKHHHER